MSTVNIRVSPETRDALTAIGGKGETYDAILRRLIWLREAVENEADDWLQGLEEQYAEKAEG